MNSLRNLQNSNSGIYTITNLVDGKILVGYSKNLKNRNWRHFNQLKNDKHHNNHLQYAVNKYGIENFIFEILEEYEPEFLPSMENWWVNMLNTNDRNFGYNLRPTSPNGHFIMSENTKLKMKMSSIGVGVGRKHTEESKKKMSLSRKGKPSINKGKSCSEETRKKISEAQIGKKLSESTIEKFRIAATGKKQTKETIEKRKKTRGVFKLSQETKDKISNKNKGRKCSEETKQKMSKSKKGISTGFGRKQKPESIEKFKNTMALKKQEKIKNGEIVEKIDKGVVSKEVRLQISNKLKGVKKTKESIEKRIITLKRNKLLKLNKITSAND